MSVSYGGDSITFADGSVQSGGWTGMRNRIINGAMMVDQRNAGAAITAASNVYTVDRFLIQGSQTGKFNVQQVTDAPAGFFNSLKFTVGTAVSVGSGDYFITRQAIEGLNVLDLDYGLATAKTVTLSFWVKSSITGVHSGHLTNNSSSRWYPFTYTINVADTWEYKTITIPGDATGTWLKTNGVGIYVGWSLGTGSTNETTANAWSASTGIGATGSVDVVATLGATWQITGVQLERGSTASSFEYRSYGTELALCQRYYEKSYNMASIAGASDEANKGTFVCATGNTFWRWTQNYRVSKRADSTFTIYSTTGASGNVRLSNGSDLAVSTEDAGENATAVFVSRNATVGDFFWWQWTASAEL